jgi:hypothetical protein
MTLRVEVASTDPSEAELRLLPNRLSRFDGIPETKL